MTAMRGWLALAGIAAGCGERIVTVTEPMPQQVAEPAQVSAKLPRAPGEHAPSLVATTGVRGAHDGEVSDGVMLSDVDSCGSCHPDAAAQWATSAHSFASFGNPIYRFNVEQVRHDLGRANSKHCGGCHDMPLVVDGLMMQDVPASDLRAHSGVTCRLCHGVTATTKDGNGSYVWSRTPLDAPVLGDAASIAAHRKQTTVKVDTELCVGCHRGFISPDMDMPVHLSGLDESGMWRNSAWTGNGMARIDQVDRKSCIDCHMEREPASARELGAKPGASGPTIASHRFVGGHTWMAAMRGDGEHLRRTQAKLGGAASIDIAGARIGAERWQLPADGAPLEVGKLALDVVIRNLLVGHRFPGGVLDMQDTWIEVEVTDRRGRSIASSGLRHDRDANDDEAHVLRSLVVDDNGRVLVEHEMAKFRTQISTQTLAAREAQTVRYLMEVSPSMLAAAEQPWTVTARLRHRSRSLKVQAATCREASSPQGKAFLSGAKGARDVVLDPCRAQPITLIAETKVELGNHARAAGAERPPWQRLYELGMALTATVTERLEESKTVLESALAAAPDPRARAMVLAQLGWVASKQGRVDDALAIVERARSELAAAVAGSDAPVPRPAVLDAIATDALARVWRWQEAVAPARACVERAPQNSQAWVMLARVLGSTGDDAGALRAATSGLEFAPRDQDLLRSQATALAALGRASEAKLALAAFDRFRSPDQSAELRIQCAADSPRCARDREPAPSSLLVVARGFR